MVCAVQEKKRQGDLQVFVSDRIFLWTLHFLPGLKCLLTDGAGRKAKVGSQEHLCTFAFIQECLEPQATK